MKAVLGQVQMHKLILLGGAEIDELRPEAEAQFAGRAALTTAIGGMLEASSLTVSRPYSGFAVLAPTGTHGDERMMMLLQILPLGASKGQAVGWLLNHMGLDAADVVAFGDGENDIEMLQLAGVGAPPFTVSIGLRARSGLRGERWAWRFALHLHERDEAFPPSVCFGKSWY